MNFKIIILEKCFAFSFPQPKKQSSNAENNLFFIAIETVKNAKDTN